MAKKGSGKSKLPKKVGGVSVPKMLRKNPLVALFDSPQGREILADALLAAAGAAAAVLVKNRPSTQQVAKAGGAVADAGMDAAVGTRDTVQGAAGVVANLVTEAAQHILPTSLTGADDEDSSKGKGRSYAHLADEDRKGKKDKQRPKASKH
jgi:hypothetical protein